MIARGGFVAACACALGCTWGTYDGNDYRAGLEGGTESGIPQDGGVIETQQIIPVGGGPAMSQDGLFSITFGPKSLPNSANVVVRQEPQSQQICSAPGTCFQTEYVVTINQVGNQPQPPEQLAGTAQVHFTFPGSFRPPANNTFIVRNQRALPQIIGGTDVTGIEPANSKLSVLGPYVITAFGSIPAAGSCKSGPNGNNPCGPCVSKFCSNPLAPAPPANIGEACSCSGGGMEVSQMQACMDGSESEQCQ